MTDEQAVSLVAPGDTIAIDAGTTGYALAEALPPGLARCVVTPSLPVLQLLGERDDVQVIGLGGEVHRPSRAFTGPLAV
jgi:DeoR family fructose operon transcriptional repressor